VSDVRALVTGATGFIGRALTARLATGGVSVWGLASSGGEGGILRGGSGGTLQADVRNRLQVAAAMDAARPTHVFHLAGLRERTRDWSRLEEAMAVNAFGTACVVAAAARAGVRRVVVMGTVDEYGPIQAPYREGDRESPQTVYGISKLSGTRAALAIGQATGLEVCVLRGSVAYGPGQPADMFIGSLVASLAAGSDFPMTSGEQLRDFVYIDDVVEALDKAARAEGAAGLILNVGMGTSVPVRAVAQLAERLLAAPGRVQVGAMPSREGEVLDYAIDVSAARNVLGWSSRVPLEEGLRRTIEAVRG
jgi:nucleoside-diphosphate-sugar epimerase